MNKYVIYVLLFLFVGYLVFGIQWSNKWEIKHRCLEEMKIPISELFPSDSDARLGDDERAKYPQFMWNVPSIVNFLPVSDETQLLELGYSGYLMPNTSEHGAKVLDRDTLVVITDNMLFHRNGIWYQLMNSWEFSISLEVTIKGESYVVFSHNLSNDLKEKLRASKCFEDGSAI